MIITVEELGEGEEVYHDGFLEMKVKVEGTSFILYEFECLEDIIELSKRFSQMKIFGGRLYSYNEYYYLLMENFSPNDLDRMIALLSEYGNVSILSPYVLEEYGINIINNNAVDTISQFFR